MSGHRGDAGPGGGTNLQRILDRCSDYGPDLEVALFRLILFVCLVLFLRWLW